MSKETADLYQEFFDFFSQEHNLHLTIGQMQEILSEAQKLESKLNIADVVGRSEQLPCEHPYHSIIGEEHGNPKCLKCSENL